MQNVNKEFIIYFLFSIIPLISICYICSPHEYSENLLFFYFIEWVLLLLGWRLICPWLGGLGVSLAAFTFLLSFVVSVLVVHDNVTFYGTVWNGSDDLWYLNLSRNVAHSLQMSGWNFVDVWFDLISVRYQGWTILGWPYVLGIVSSLAIDNPSLIDVHAISLSLNAVFLSLILALILHILRDYYENSVRLVFICFLLLIGDPVVYTGSCLKETLLTFSLMLVFCIFFKIFQKFKIMYALILIMGILGVLTTRPVYLLIFLLIFYAKFTEIISLKFFTKLIFGILLLFFFASSILNVQIRESTIGDRFTVKKLSKDSGTAMSVYNLPIVGPVLFYAISPTPPLPWKLFDQKQLSITIMRSFGSTLWFFSLFYVFIKLIDMPYIIKNKVYFYSLLVFVCLFAAVVMSGDDPRYKLTSNFFLSIILYLSIYYKKLSIKIDC